MSTIHGKFKSQRGNFLCLSLNDKIDPVGCFSQLQCSIFYSYSTERICDDSHPEEADVVKT
jgi:hypothetical protein